MVRPLKRALSVTLPNIFLKSVRLSPHAVPSLWDQRREVTLPDKTFTVRIAAPKDYPKVLDFFSTHFMGFRPSKEILPSTPEYEEDMRALVEVMLPHNLSLIAEEEGGEEMASVFINYFHSPSYPLDEGFKFNSWQARFMWETLQGLKSESNLDHRLKDSSSSYVEMFAGAVAEPYKRMGLAGGLAEKCLYLFEELGYRDVVVCCSSPYARQLVLKLGFRKLHNWELEDVLEYFYEIHGGWGFMPSEVIRELKLKSSEEDGIQVSLHRYDIQRP